MSNGDGKEDEDGVETEDVRPPGSVAESVGGDKGTSKGKRVGSGG
jgi:hypothetical protein